jgi:hypothetical protein
MRYFRRLPPILRVASVVGLLFALASLALLIEMAVVMVMSFPSFPPLPADFNRVFLLAVNLGLVSGPAHAL